MAHFKFVDKDLAAPVSDRVKIFDKIGVKGLYASKTPNVTTFAYRYWDERAKKNATVKVGTFHPVEFTCEHARREALRMQADVKVHGKDIAKQIRHAAVIAHAGTISFNTVADKYIAWCQTLERKPDGGMRARKESFQTVVYALVRPRAAFGSKAIADVTDDDIVEMLDGVEGKTGMILNIRMALNCVFKWSMEAGRKYVTFNPCVTLPPPPDKLSKDRFLTDEEIKRLWWGLDQPALPGGRHVALALKLILTTALRPGEVLTMRRDAIGKIGQQRGGDGLPAVVIPLEEVKLRRPIIQPLNSLAQEAIAELLAMDGGETLFPANLTPHMLARALRSKTRKRRGRVDHYVGVLEFLGFTAKRGQPFAPFTPHDLRRTAATQLDFADVSTKAISRILDHTSKEAGVGSATKIYIADAGKQTPRRRVTLDQLDGLLRGFIGPAPSTNVVRFRAA